MPSEIGEAEYDDFNEQYMTAANWVDVDILPGGSIPPELPASTGYPATNPSDFPDTPPVASHTSDRSDVNVSGYGSSPARMDTGPREGRHINVSLKGKITHR